MPIYEYKCPTHGKFEKFYWNTHIVVDTLPCPICSGESPKVFSAFGLLQMQLDDFPTIDKGRLEDERARGRVSLNANEKIIHGR